MIVDVCPEFGYEIACTIPYAYWLHVHGELEKVVTCNGMTPFYYFCDNVEERYSVRSIDNFTNGVQNLPNGWIHHNSVAIMGKSYGELSDSDRLCVNGVLDYSKWLPPPFKEQYGKKKIILNKPFIVVSNRYNYEHNNPPTGYFDIPCLYEIFNYLTEAGYSVIYKRPKNTEFSIDHNEQMSLTRKLIIMAEVEGIGNISDYDLTKYYLDVHLLDDIVSTNTGTYNEIQLRLFSAASGFISMAGGSGILCSCFGVPNITYVTTSGELRPNYFQVNSYYRKLSSADIYPIIDNEVDIKSRGYRNYSELFTKVKQVFTNII